MATIEQAYRMPDGSVRVVLVERVEVTLASKDVDDAKAIGGKAARKLNKSKLTQAARKAFDDALKTTGNTKEDEKGGGASGKS